MALILNQYLPKDQAAAELGKKPRTLDRWHMERRGPKRTKIGRSVYYSKRAIEIWLEQQTEETVRAR